MGKNNKNRSRDYRGYWDTVKTLPSLWAKIEYTWENWRVQILSVAFVLVLVISVVVTNLIGATPSYLHGVYLNMVTADMSDEYRANHLDQVFLHDYLGLAEDENITMSFEDNLPLSLSVESDTSGSTYNTITKLDAQIPSNAIDYFFMTEDVVTWVHGRYGNVLLDLREFMTEEELEQYAHRLRYTSDGVPIALDITDSTLLADMSMSAEMPVCFSWFAYVEDQEHMRPFFDFLLTTLP